DLEDWAKPTTTKQFLAQVKSWSSQLAIAFAGNHFLDKWTLFTIGTLQWMLQCNRCESTLEKRAPAKFPRIGAGAGMAMEATYVLSNLITSVAGVGSIKEALRA
ncbi:hypothetical protein T440DRAFT_525109, partial [Plenodomus tracheiphilus IPT5]